MIATNRTRRTGHKARALTVIRRTHTAAMTASKALGYRTLSGIIASHVATGHAPLRVWAQHRTTGKWIHVHVYGAIDEALYAGLDSYKGTQHLLRTSYSEAA